MKKSQFKMDIHQIFLLTKRNFSDWGKNPRIWMTFALGFVLCLMLTNQILEQAQTFQTPVQMFEPLIWTFGDAQSVMLSSLLLLLLFADMPFVNQMTPYWLIRTKRSVWMASQILYVILAAGVMIFAGGVPGVSAVLTAGGVFLYYARMTRRIFGGMTGDLAGYFLQLCEIWMAAAAVIADILWKGAGW